MLACFKCDISNFPTFLGDEILSINSKPLHGMTHAEAIAEFKSVKAGDVVLHVGRRVNKKKKESLTLAPVNPPVSRQPVKWIHIKVTAVNDFSICRTSIYLIFFTFCEYS